MAPVLSSILSLTRPRLHHYLSQYDKVKNSVMIFDEFGAWGLRNSDVVKALLQ